MQTFVGAILDAWPFLVVAFVIASVIGAERRLPYVQAQMKTRAGFFFATLPVQPLVLGIAAGLLPLPVHSKLLGAFTDTPIVIVRVLYYVMAGALSGQVFGAVNRLVKAYLRAPEPEPRWPVRPRGPR